VRDPIGEAQCEQHEGGDERHCDLSRCRADSYIHVNICISGTFPCSVVSEMRHVRGLRAGLHCLDFALQIVGVRTGL